MAVRRDPSPRRSTTESHTLKVHHSPSPGRAAAPLTMAEDAHHIDTTPFTLDEVIDQVVTLVQKAQG